MAVRSSISNKNKKPVGEKVPTGSVYDKIQMSIKYFICLGGNGRILGMEGELI